MASMKGSVTETLGTCYGRGLVWLSALALVVSIMPDVGAQSSEKWEYTLGLGLGTAPDYEGGDDYEAVPVPVARAQKGHRFANLFGLHATSNLVDHPVWRLGPSIKYQAGYSDVDNNRVDDLTNRGGVWLGGAKAGYVIGFQGDSHLQLGLEMLYGGNRGGFLYTPFAEYNRPIGQKWNLTAILDTTYASGAYMSHFFSVNQSDAQRSGLKERDADADFKDAGLTALMMRQFGDHWNAGLVAQYKRMLGDADDSPIVDDEGDENQYFGAVVVSYTF
jgi:outer membrane protein